MTNKFTPGPWTVAVGTGTMVVANRVAAIATTYGEDAEANAKLIAAAPMLLEACRRLHGVMTGLGYEGDPSAEFAAEIIAAATGEQPLPPPPV